MSTDDTYSKVCKNAKYILSKTNNIKPTIGIICGSGLGNIANAIKDQIKISYKEIPSFPSISVAGHDGELVIGKLSGKTVVAMKGRFHMYEGFTNDEIAIPIRTLKMIGVEVLLVTNAAGGLNRSYKAGDLVIIKDHISFPGLSARNALLGPNDERFGTRFVATSDAYNKDLRALAETIAKEQNFHNILHTGVYVHVSGPTYESPAECKMLLNIGADVVGMSTVPEIVIARHCDIKCFGVSLVTNVSIMDTESENKANHEEVLQMANSRAEIMQNWFQQLILRMK